MLNIYNKIKFQENFIFFLFVGFLCSSIFSYFLRLENINIIYRGIMMLISLFIILKNFLEKKIPSRFKLIMIFLFLYSIRLIYDLFFDFQIVLWREFTKFTYLQYFFGIILLPCIALMYIDYNKLDYNYILKKIYFFLFFLITISFFFRFESGGEGRDVGELSIGVLIYGQFGASLCLLSIFRLFFSKDFYSRLFYIIGFIIGFISIFISASRSPLLALLLVTIYFIYKYFGATKSLIIYCIIFAILFFSFLDIVEILNFYFNSNFLERVIYALEGSDSGRSVLLNSGINDFINYPFFGSSFVLQSGPSVGLYPHNLVVESLMALGIFGGLIFIFIILININKLNKFNYNKSNLSWLGLLFLQYLIFAMFSGSLYTSDIFWVLCVLIVGIRNLKLK